MTFACMEEILTEPPAFRMAAFGMWREGVTMVERTVIVGVDIVLVVRVDV